MFSELGLVLELGIKHQATREVKAEVWSHGPASLQVSKDLQTLRFLFNNRVSTNIEDLTGTPVPTSKITYKIVPRR